MAQTGVTRSEILAVKAESPDALAPLIPDQEEPGSAYECWIKGNDSLQDIDRQAIRTHIAVLTSHPVISVILPIGNVAETALRRSFASVFAQAYPYWKLIAPVDHSGEELLNRACPNWLQDPRIRVLDSATNVIAAINAAIGEVTSDFVTFFRAGDLLPEHAFYEVAVELAADPAPDILYSDCDQIDASDRRSNPWFKTGWDPDLLLAYDYLSDLIVYRRTLLEQIGLLRPEFEGAELHDLALRATGAARLDRIRHIPAILYHKSSSNEKIGSERLRGVAAWRRAVREYLDARGDNRVLLRPAPLMPDANRVVWPVPDPSPFVTVIVPTRDRADLLAQCAQGILHRTDHSNLELLIVDNSSIEPATLALFDRLTREDRRVRLLHFPGPFNYSALMNAAARESKGEILVLLNNDIDVIEPGWLGELVSHAVRPDVGIVGAKLIYANGQVQHGGIVMGPDGHAHHVHRYMDRNNPGYCGQLAVTRTYSVVTGACLAIRRRVFFEVGGLDEVNLKVAFNDVDLCLRVGDHGYRVVWTPFAELFHLESASRGQEDDPVKQGRFHREWYHMKKTWLSLMDNADPFHNPNLLLSHGCNAHEILFPPRRKPTWHKVLKEVSSLTLQLSI